VQVISLRPSKDGVDALAFGVEVVAVSASGVLAPGPLFVANMLWGTKQGTMSGVRVAHGHAAVEIVVVAAIAAGIFSASAFPSEYARAIALVGGAAILGFAAMQVLGIATNKGIKVPALPAGKSPFAVGAVLTGLNPLFLVWWLTVGLKLVSDSAAFGPATGVALLFAMHVWMDYAWLAATAYLASKGRSALRSKYYKGLLLALAGVLVYYGAQFLINGIK
jgi:threonine/homoserine/homoserine lactone efflux protein